MPVNSYTPLDIQTPADAGFALIVAHREGNIGLTKRAAQFAGQLVANDAELTEPQKRWLDQLLGRAGISAQFAKDAT